MSLFSHSVNLLSLSASSCSLQLNSLSSCFKRSSVSSISHLTERRHRKFYQHKNNLHANIKIGNNHFVIPSKCTFDLKEFDCNFYPCQQVVLYAKQSNPPHKAFSEAIYKQVCEVRPECPPPQPLCPQKPYQPLPKPLHTHSQNFPSARIDFSTTLMRSVSRMSHPPSSSPLLLFAFSIPLSSFLPSCTAAAKVQHPLFVSSICLCSCNSYI